MRFFKIVTNATTVDERFIRKGDAVNRTLRLFKSTQKESFIGIIDYEMLDEPYLPTTDGPVEHKKKVDELSLLCIDNVGIDIKATVKEYGKLLGMVFEILSIEELTISKADDAIDQMRGSRWNIVKSVYGFDALWRGAAGFGENIIETYTKKEKRAFIRDNLFGGTLAPEFERIRQGSVEKVSGNPVHYIVRTLSTDNELRRDTCKMLLSELYSNQRIENKRYIYTDFNFNSREPVSSYEALFKMSEGGAIVLRYSAAGAEDENSPFAPHSLSYITEFCNLIKKYRHKVLSILHIPTSSDKAHAKFLEGLSEIGVVTITQDVIFGAPARNYLKLLCKKYNVNADDRLLSSVEKEKGYNSEDLNGIFNEWYEKSLRTSYYPQYSGVSSAKALAITEAPKSSALKELEAIIGCKEAKATLNNALNYFKAQKLFEGRGLTSERPSLTFMFTGNPGVAKTTVARLFGSVLFEEGIIRSSKFVEAGRSDLVDRYLGGTAPRVRAQFANARGGVLFIDEAYDICTGDGSHDPYGEEAIATIVQEMENHRSDTVVIFAGYEKEMMSWMSKNPGLASRINFKVNFPDYSIDELLDIADYYAERNSMVLPGETKDTIKDVLVKAKMASDFGNGRTVRNILQQSKMSQATRLLSLDIDSLTEEDFKILLPEDIVEPFVKPKDGPRPIGFCA